MKARPVIQVARLRPESRKSRLGAHEALQRHADAEHEDEVEPDDGVVDRVQLHEGGLSVEEQSAASTQLSSIVQWRACQARRFEADLS